MLRESNRPMRPIKKLVLLAATALLAGGCATTPMDPTVLDNARFAIEQADAAGAEEFAPLELRFARESVEMAESLIEDGGDADSIRRLADEAEIEAQLALTRTRAALARAERDAARNNLVRLEEDLAESFGDEVLEE